MGRKKKRAASKVSVENCEKLVDLATNTASIDLKNGKREEKKEKYTAKDLLERVEQYVESFEYELALKFCKKALDLEPANITVLETYGNTCAEVNDVENARKYLLKAIALEPERGYVKYLYLGQLSESVEAVDCFEKAIKLMKELAGTNSNTVTDSKVLKNKDISSVYCSLAEIYMTDCCMEEDAEQKCESYCKEAVEIDSENTDAYIIMCNFLLSREDLEMAKNTAEKAFNLWKRTTEVAEEHLPEIISYESRVTLIKILIEVECYDKVSLIVDQLIEENEDDIRIWYYLGLAKSLLNGSDNPRFYLEKALELFEKTDYKDIDMKNHISELLETCPHEDEELMDTIQEEEVISENDENEMEMEE